MKVGFLITARLKSTRLPKKAMRKILNKPFLSYMIERVKLSDKIDKIVLATSTNPEDEPLCKLAKEYDIACFKGSEDDVLDRLYHAAEGLDYIFNLTADCPLVAFEYFEEVLETYKKTNADMITIEGLPHGLFFWGLKVSAIKKVLEMKADSDTEVWGRYFKDVDEFTVVDVPVPKDMQRSNYRLTLDYEEDLEFFTRLFTEFPEAHLKPSKEILEFLDNHPDIVEINKHCEELYLKRWKSQEKLVLK